MQYAKGPLCEDVLAQLLKASMKAPLVWLCLLVQAVLVPGLVPGVRQLAGAGLQEQH